MRRRCEGLAYHAGMGVVADADAILRPRGVVFFGWWIVGSSAVIQCLAGMLWMHATGAYMVFLQSEFAWSATVFSIAFAMTRVESGLLGPLQGWLTDRFGPPTIMRIGTVLFGLGFFLFALVDSVWTFFGAYAVIAIGSSLGGFATLMVSIVNWFDRHRAKAVAISQMGFAVGGLCVPLVILCLETFGWRVTAVISGFLVMAAGMPLSYVLRHRPQPHGEVPDGLLLPPEQRSAASRRSGEAGTRDFTAGEAARTPAFWLISGSHALSLLVVSGVMLHLIPHLTNGLGYGVLEAGYVVGMLTGFQLLGQLCGGYLGDRFSKRWICAICMLAHCAGLLMVTWATSFLMVFAFTLLHGVAWGTRGPLMVALRADYFGSQSFGTIMGWSSLIVMLGMSGGPVVAGVMRDIYGDYQLAFTALAVASLLGFFGFLAATPPARPRIQEGEEAPA